MGDTGGDTGGRYGDGDEPDSESYAETTVEARDGEVWARVTVETEAPSMEAAGALNDALSSAVRTVVHAVFSGEGVAGPALGESPASAGGTGEGDEEGSEGRIMDYERSGGKQT